MAAADFRCLAQVLDTDRATDLAIALSSTRLVVVRCVDRVLPEDHAALATMVAEGDFIWAGLVYGGQEELQPVGPVETFHVRALDRLVARLHQIGSETDEAS